MIKRFVKFLSFIFVIVTTFVFLAFYPKYTHNLTYKNYNATINRDQWGIPFIQASNQLSFFYSFGWVIGQDRSFQLAFRKLLIQGRLSEKIGEKTAKFDQMMREINVKKWSLQSARNLQKANFAEYQKLEAFVQGINDCVKNKKFLAMQFHIMNMDWQQWKVETIFEVYKLMEWSQTISVVQQLLASHLLLTNSRQQVFKILRLTKQNWIFNSTTILNSKQIPEHLKTSREQIMQEIKMDDIGKIMIENIQSINQYKTVQGSNSWVISGNHTESGKPILVNDPHLQNTIPSNWYQIKGCIMTNKRRCLSGVVIPGLPFIIGEYDYWAFGVTTIYTDNTDLYQQQIVDNKYFLDNQWKQLIIRQQIIKIKTKEGIQEKRIQIKQTHRGPLLSSYFCGVGSVDINKNISMRYTGANSNYQFLVASLNAYKFQTLQQIQNFCINNASWSMNLNVIFSTVDNNIGYCRGGIYPVRKNKQLSYFVKNGRTSQHDWLGFLTPRDRVFVTNPQKGYIITANNKIAQKQLLNNYNKFHIYTARSDRINIMIKQVLQKGLKFNKQIMKNMLSDTIDVYCLQILPTIIKLLKNKSQLFEQFDCNMSKQSISATYYQVFLYQIHKYIKPAQITKISIMSLHSFHQSIYSFIIQAYHTNSKQKIQIINKAWKNTLATFQNGQVKWGKYHTHHLRHLPFSPTILGYLFDVKSPGYGNLNTVNVGKMNKVGFGNFQLSHCATYRCILTHDEESQWILDTGVNQNILSPHYSDQQRKFQSNQLIKINIPKQNAKQVEL